MKEAEGNAVEATYSDVHDDGPAVLDLERMVERPRLAVTVVVAVGEARKLAQVFAAFRLRQLLAVVRQLLDGLSAVSDLCHQLLFGVVADIAGQSSAPQHRDGVFAGDLQQLLFVDRRVPLGARAGSRPMAVTSGTKRNIKKN